VIAVIASPDDYSVVEEFFELFKTPWEFYVPGRSYDVVVSSHGNTGAVDTKLLIVFDSCANSIDGIAPRRTEGPTLLQSALGALPIYKEILTFDASHGQVMCSITGGAPVVVQRQSGGTLVVLAGYNLFAEVRYLLGSGQPTEHAQLPALDLHIALLRQWILASGIQLLEIPPAPAGHPFIVCLTHDIDFVGIRRHFLDHSMWGFLYRATIGAVHSFIKGRQPISKVLASLRAAVSLPFVYMGWAADFWMPFEWYLRVEQGHPATYFLIPFKRRPGDKVGVPGASRRATAYDVDDISDWMVTLKERGCELGVHGIDAWHNIERGRDELGRLAAHRADAMVGIRMHWLLRDTETPLVLERAGYAYDSTVGYNDAVGYRAGTGQVFRPIGCERLLELPLHIQDGALFYAGRLNLSELEAEHRCDTIIQTAAAAGGVLTLLWHDRSHGPERFWGDFYVRLVRRLEAMNAYFASAGQAVGWFRQRRAVSFVSVETPHGARRVLRSDGSPIEPPLRVRLHQSASAYEDIAWDGSTDLDLDALHASDSVTSAVPVAS
jgi:hypothetical protein